MNGQGSRTGLSKRQKFPLTTWRSSWAGLPAVIDPAWNELVKRFTQLVWSICCAHGLGSAEAGAFRQAWLCLPENFDPIKDQNGSLPASRHGQARISRRCSPGQTSRRDLNSFT
jgi:hypothetical protein